jgi:predicted dithiol-disulfide oxidoreductase (DUF899 family)
MRETVNALPQIVSAKEWRDAREKLLVKEKELTRVLDALAAERRRLPMVRIEKSYTFEGPQGKASLLDLFEGRRQLIVYHFMFAPPEETVDPGPSGNRSDVKKNGRTLRQDGPKPHPMCGGAGTTNTTTPFHDTHREMTR